MKKFLGIIIAIMMLLIATPFISTDSFGIDIPSVANIFDSPVVIVDAWIEIINSDGTEVWDQNEDVNLRSDSYINDGEKLVVNVIISDVNGIFQDPPSHIIDAYLSPQDNYLGELVFQSYIDAPTTALFNLIYTMDNPDIVQCLHDVYIIINEGTPYTIYGFLYVNPYVTSSFSDASVVWTELYAGTTDKEADDNPYQHEVGAYCTDGEIYYYVDVDYRLFISGTDMTQVGVTDIIPCENISYDMGSPPTNPLPETSTLLGAFVANTPLTFNFFIDVPSIIQTGAYTGEINFVVEVI